MKLSHSELIKQLNDDGNTDFLDTVRTIVREEEKLIYPDKLRIIERFTGMLFTDQIIILSGPPGTGKTSLPFAVAKAIGATCTLIPVQPNWTDNQDLMGYYNPLKNDGKGGYSTTPFLDVLLQAKEDPDTVFFVVLDEMNLAHVEYYFSTMLSIMETADKKIWLYSDKLNHDSEILPEITYPENLQIIGTLNMDETTKGISPKVIDRSYVLEIPGNGNIQETDNGELLSDKQFDEENGIRDMIGRKLETDLSFRLKKHYEKMSERKFLKVDDYIAGKVLPMIRDKQYENEISLDGYPISNNKLSRMKRDFGNGKVKYDFWGTD